MPRPRIATSAVLLAAVASMSVLTAPVTSAVPAQQPGSPAGTRWTSISGGSSHTCAVRFDATLWCWGDNSTGQLGLGDDVDRLVPTRV